MQSSAAPALMRAIAWAGGSLFVVSLIFGAFTYLVVMRPTSAGPTLWPVLADVALFSAFALHHSVFARERVRGWIRRIVSERLERSAYVWIASVLFIEVCALWQPVPGALWDVFGPAAWGLRAVQIAGVWITIRSATAIDALELAGVRQAIGVRPQDPEFTTSGPYGWVRHPIYTGWFMMVFAEPVMTYTRLVFAVVSGLYLLVAIPFEERSLRQTTGGAYERYARIVRWKLIPGVY